MDTPDLSQGAWRFYARPLLPTDLPAAKAEAFAQFRARYGVPPAHVLDDGRYLYAGPVPEQKAHDTAQVQRWA